MHPIVAYCCSCSNRLGNVANEMKYWMMRKIVMAEEGVDYGRRNESTLMAADL